MTDRERTMSTGKIAAAVGLSAASIQAYARDGRLPHRMTPGRHYRFNLDEVREVLTPALVSPADDLMDVFADTGAPVDALSGFRPSPFTEDVMSRQRARAHRREDLTRDRKPVEASAGSIQFIDLVERSGHAAAVAVLHRG